MKWGEKIRMAIRSFLRIEPADVRSFNLKERFDFTANAFKNSLWYRGDADELNQFYAQVPNETMGFWGSVSTKGKEIRKLHTGLPAIIADTLAQLVTSDMNDLEFENVEKNDVWAAVGEENGIKDLVKQAVTDCLVIGDGAFKVSLDPSLSEYPIVEWYSGENVDFMRKRGRIVGVTFYSKYKPKNGGLYVLKEYYGMGCVEYHLFRGESEVPLNTIPETADLADVKFDDSFMMAIPFMISKSAHYKGRGQSAFDRKIDNFDALDEVYSQWWQAMRDSRPTKYIPDVLIPRNPNNGDLIRPNPFDNQFIKTSPDMSENGKNQIDVTQPEFRSNEYTATYVTALDLCLQGLISPSTLGIDVKKLDNAEAQREKEKATLYTRQNIIEALTPAIKSLVDVVFKVWATVNGEAMDDTDVDVSFGEYANPSFEAVVETLSNPNTPMSIEAKVDEMWGDTKDQKWKDDEVSRIKEQTGIVSMEEPAVKGAVLDGDFGQLQSVPNAE